MSNLTGAVARADESTDPDYWVRHVRETVRFADGVGFLHAEGVRTFLELGPDGVLSAAGAECVPDGDVDDDGGGGSVFVPVLRSGRQPDVESLFAALGRLWTRGGRVDWPAVFSGTGARRVDLPTYPFQRRRYWPTIAPAPAGDVGMAGMTSPRHPLLGAAVALADGDGILFTGRLSVQTHPWLADHEISGVVLVPGTALLEMAIRAGDQVGCDTVEELTLQNPLALPERGAVAVQLTVGGPDESGRRPIGIYSRLEDAADDAWTRNAAGFVAEGGDEPATTAADSSVWPPAGAEAVDLDVDGFYEGLALGGFGYGPTFQGLRAAWRRGEDVFAEVAFPDGAGSPADPTRFGLHPALLDAALHAVGLGSFLTSADGQDRGRGHLPFSWNDVTLHATGASVLRVRLSPAAMPGSGDAGGGIALTVADGAGRPVASVGSLVLRPVSPEHVRAAGTAGQGSLYRITWVPVSTPSSPPANPPRPGRYAVVGADRMRLGAILGADSHPDLDAFLATVHTDAPDLVLVPFSTDPGSGPGAGPEPNSNPDPNRTEVFTPAIAHDSTVRALRFIQSWLADERLADVPLAIVTRGAVSAGSDDEEPADLAHAPLWGLVRSAQSEHPGRILLIDVDLDLGSGAEGEPTPTPMAMARRRAGCWTRRSPSRPRSPAASANLSSRCAVAGSWRRASPAPPPRTASRRPSRPPPTAHP